MHVPSNTAKYPLRVTRSVIGMNRRQWLPLIGLTLSVFVFNMSEFMPIGLLTGIADDFGIVESGAADELFANPRQDYTRELIRAVPGAGIDLYGDEAPSRSES